MSTQNQTLNTCGCCEGIKVLTPVTIDNQPGLSALAYRAGTWGSFLKSMLAEISGEPALAELTTREADDPVIGLLDSWATLLDVLTFYQERIINEGFLRTATERRSVLELAREISYRLGPGVAAETYLAFLLDETPGAPDEAFIATGMKTQTVPGQDQKPQIFETVEDLTAEKELNVLRPKLTEKKTPGMGNGLNDLSLEGTQTGLNYLYLNGTQTGLKQGDPLLIINSDFPDGSAPVWWIFCTLSEVTPNPDAGQTKVSWGQEFGKPWNSSSGSPSFDHTKIYALRQKASLFGYNAPYWKALPYNVRKASTPSGGDPHNYDDWPLLTIRDISRVPSGDIKNIYLDNTYPKIVNNSLLVMFCEGSSPMVQLHSVASSVESARNNFMLASKTTEVTFTEGILEGFNKNVREITVYAQSSEKDELKLAEYPIPDSSFAQLTDKLTLDHPVSSLSPNKALIISGTLFNSKPPETVCETVVIDSIGTDKVTLKLKSKLVNKYEWNTVSIYGNVAKATHGESKTEVLGSGDGSKTFQQFDLKQKPLTYVHDTVSTGSSSTLAIRVNDILWTEVPTLYGCKPGDRVYVTRLADDGTVTVQFGDGITGSRLPTGTENVTASYRVGIGFDGQAVAGQITQLLTRPLGVKSVTNPMAAAGADDPESMDNARQNAPLHVLALDRIVSLQDYEDVARAFAGIGKARADLVWSGEQPVVCLTIAAADGSTVDKSSTLCTDLLAAINKERHPKYPVRVGSYIPRYFSLKAGIVIGDAYLPEKVIASAGDALTNAFSFGNRDFGQGLAASMVISVIQQVEGVIAVRLDSLAENVHDPADTGTGKYPKNGTGRFVWRAGKKGGKKHFVIYFPKFISLPSFYPENEALPVNPSDLLMINPLGIDIYSIQP